MDPTTHLEGTGFDEALDELIGCLTGLRTWCATHGQDIWVRELERDLALLRQHDAYGLDRFLGHFGSMGSIGDIGVQEAEPILTRAYLLATVLRQSLER